MLVLMCGSETFITYLSMFCPLPLVSVTPHCTNDSNHNPRPPHSPRQLGRLRTNDHVVRSNAAVVTCISSQLFRCVKILCNFFIAHMHVCLYILVGNLHIKWIKGLSDNFGQSKVRILNICKNLKFRWNLASLSGEAS